MDGKKLLKIRNSLGLTQKEMAKMMGIAWQTLSAVENGREISESKKRTYEIALDNVLKETNSYHLVKEDQALYHKSDSLQGKDVFHEILIELKEIRSENKQLHNKVEKIQEDNENEKKMNDLLRKQLQLAINVLKDLDLELMEKSTRTKNDVGKLQ